MIDAKTLVGADGLYPDDIAEILANADPVKRGMLMRIGRAVVDHDRYDRAMKWLDDLYSEHGTGREATAGLLYGPPGVGKSTVLRKFVAKRSGPFETSKGSVRPVVLIEVPSNPTEINLFDSFLIALGVEDMCTGNAEDRKRSVTVQLKEQHVHMIILDEFTHVIEDKTERFTKKAMRQLKSLLSQGICQVVFAGTEELVSLHELYGQVKRRDSGDFVMTPFDWSDPDDRAEWGELLGVIATTLTIPASPGLDDGKRARSLHTATGGNLDSLMKLLFRATAIAYDEGEPAITDAILAEAFEFRRRGDKTENPFGKPKRRPRKLSLQEAPANEVTGLRKMTRQPSDSFSKG